MIDYNMPYYGVTPIKEMAKGFGEPFLSSTSLARLVIVNRWEKNPTAKLAELCEPEVTIGELDEASAQTGATSLLAVSRARYLFPIRLAFSDKQLVMKELERVNRRVQEPIQYRCDFPKSRSQ